MELTAALSGLQRGPYLGQLEGFDGVSGLCGWACRWPPDADQAPLTVHLILEDLMNGASRWQLDALLAQRPRPDLHVSGVERACGFAFRGHSGTELPPHSSGMVLRAFFDPERRVELPGSPLRLDSECYQLLRQLCRTGLGRRASIAGVQAGELLGWAVGPEPLQLRIDGGDPLPIQPPDPLPAVEWPFQLSLPSGCCDGRIHHLELEDAEGGRISESLELIGHHLTPWPALLEHGQPPFPDQLSPLAREHYRSLHTWLSWADADGTPLPPQLPLLQRLLSQPVRLDERGSYMPPGLEPGPHGAPELRQPLLLPVSDAPVVSVVIPVHNQYAVTRRCLAAIAYAPSRVPIELIVVDDGSTDGTAEALAREASAVRVIRHDFARGFNQACCSGVAVARGDFVLLLNNDTEPCAAWLEELLDPFQRWPDTGLVGAQLILPDGRLQEAGCIVWGNGEPWNVGRGGNPYDPRFAYARQVDYVSGAVLVIRRQLWNRVGGFSPEFSPAYYEDTDLAFKVRAAGYRVRYAPLARVIHHEGLSNGSDPKQSEGLKRYQEINAPLFKRKWAEAFDGPLEPSLKAAQVIKDRGILGRALFLDHETPRPDRDAGSHAAVVEMDLVQALGWKVTFLPANLAWLGRYTEALQRRGVELLHAPFVLSLEQLLRERGSEFELIYITRYTVAEAALPLIEAHAPQARILFCNADLHHLRQLRALRAEGLTGEAAERALAAVAEVQRRELAVMGRVHLTFSYSEVERAVIEAESLGAAATAACPWVVDGPAVVAPLAGRSGLAFLGSYNHPPNRDAIESFLADLWPTLRQRRPTLKLHLYGSGLSPELSQRWAVAPGVVVEGWVADPATVYERHRLFIAPLRSGAGLKGKVVAAAAHGIPQVLSPLAAESTGLRHGSEVWVAREPDDWLEAISRLDSDDDSWLAMSAAAFRYATGTWSRERGLAQMADAFRRLGLPHHTPKR